jgi:sigma-B regulation protein RsbU (phosphoserine phosphatase)
LSASVAGRLLPGDMLILYTDGITEAPNIAAQEFGEERLAALALKIWKEGGSPEQFMTEVVSAIDAWTTGEPHQDDLTMVVIARGR